VPIFADLRQILTFVVCNAFSCHVAAMRIHIRPPRHIVGVLAGQPHIVAALGYSPNRAWKLYLYGSISQI
jgi:hypothetical protein